MWYGRKLLIATGVLAGSFVPAAGAFAGMNLGNHSETLVSER